MKPVRFYHFNAHGRVFSIAAESRMEAEQKIKNHLTRNRLSHNYSPTAHSPREPHPNADHVIKEDAGVSESLRVFHIQGTFSTNGSDNLKEEVELTEENCYYVTYNHPDKEMNRKLLHKVPLKDIHSAKDLIDNLSPGHPKAKYLGRIHTVNKDGKIVKIHNYDGSSLGYGYSPALGDAKHVKELKEETSLDEALTIQQRQKRAQIMRRNAPKIKRARILAQHRMAPAKNIKNRAFIQARDLVRKRLAGKRGAEYEKLGPSEKIIIDKQVEKKKKLIKKLALRLLPRVKQAEQKRLQSFLHGKPLENLGAPEGHKVAESINQRFSEALDIPTAEHSEKVKTKVSIDPQDEPAKDGGKAAPGNKNIILYSKFSEEKHNESADYKALVKKSEKHGIDLETLGEVYDRGYAAWTEGRGTPSQAAFARVNSFINQGKSYFEEDADLHEISQVAHKNYFRAAHQDVNKRLKTANTDKDYDKIYSRERSLERVSDKLRGHLANYKSKHVQGLYHSSHDEHPDGSFVQRRVNGPWLHHDAVTGNRTHHEKYADLVAHVNKLHNDPKRKAVKEELEEVSEATGSFDWKALAFDNEHRRVINKFNHELQYTTKDHPGKQVNGRVVGHDPDKAGHVLLRVHTARGVRSKNDDQYEDHSVREKHLTSDFNKWGAYHKEDLDEARQPSPALKAAQDNLGKVLAPGYNAPKKTPSGDSLKKKFREMETEARAKVKHHLAKFKEHQAAYKEHNDLYHHIESHPGEFSLPGSDHHGALEEVQGILDHHAEKMEHHYQLMHKHNNSLEKPYKLKDHHFEEPKIDESNNTPYVRPHVNSQGEEIGWKSSNKHGKVKFWQPFAKESALKHAGLTEENLEEIKLGDRVHLGFGAKSGAGYIGKVTHVDDEKVHIIHPSGKTYEGPRRFATAIHESNSKKRMKVQIVDRLGSKASDDPETSDKHQQVVHKIIETAFTSDKEPVVVPTHFDSHGNRIPAKTVMRRTKRAIVNSKDNPNDGQ